jgi:hypothetical protein
MLRIRSTRPLPTVWRYGTGKTTTVSREPIAIYTIDEIQRGRRPRFRIDLLTDVGHNGIGPASFKTMEAAQDYCEQHLAAWRSQIQDSDLTD